MLVIHELEFDRKCPLNDALDHYEARFETRAFLQVEDILKAIEKLPAKAFQEEITRELADELGCAVTTIGYHSGVKTTCTA